MEDKTISGGRRFIFSKIDVDSVRYTKRMRKFQVDGGSGVLFEKPLPSLCLKGDINGLGKSHLGKKKFLVKKKILNLSDAKLEQRVSVHAKKFRQHILSH